MSKERKIGTNGVEFGKGYKGPGMCNNCLLRGPKIPNQQRYLCTHYGGSCQSVSRNCTGIKQLGKPKESEPIPECPKCDHNTCDDCRSKRRL